MRFWDSSAIVPLAVTEGMSGDVNRLLRQDPRVVRWWGAPVECASALARGCREGATDFSAAAEAREVLRAFWAGTREIQASEVVRERAVRLLDAHPLREADALQLAAALVWCGGEPAGKGFVCLDERLRKAASREGFAVVP